MNGFTNYDSFERDIKQNINKAQLKVIIKKYFINIRVCLTTIDFFIKAFEQTDDRNTKLIEKYIWIFDNCIRTRQNIFKAPKTFIDNELCNKIEPDEWESRLPVEPGYINYETTDEFCDRSQKCKKK